MASDGNDVTRVGFPDELLVCLGAMDLYELASQPIDYFGRNRTDPTRPDPTPCCSTILTSIGLEYIDPTLSK